MVGALEAVRKRVGVRVVEKRVVSITPREPLGSDAEVLIRHKVRLLMGLGQSLHVGVGHAHGDPRDGQGEGQDLPGTNSSLVTRR